MAERQTERERERETGTATAILAACLTTVSHQVMFSHVLQGEMELRVHAGHEMYARDQQQGQQASTRESESVIRVTE